VGNGNENTYLYEDHVCLVIGRLYLKPSTKRAENKEEEEGEELGGGFLQHLCVLLQNLCLSIRSRSFTPHQFLCQSISCE
jgi:hypothetical protein